MEHDRSFCLPGIALDRSCGETLQRQLYSRIAEAIRTGEIVRGARLPSTRSMANKLGVSRNTVLAAYDALVADELICGERGSGMRVSGGAETTGMQAIGLRRVLRDARYPVRAISLMDPDGNLLYVNF